MPSLGSHCRGYFKGAESLINEVLDKRNIILGVEHAERVRAMVNPAATYHCLGKYRGREAEYARNRCKKQNSLGGT